MPLSPAKPRSKKHIRRILLEGFQREDGLFDIEGTLTDQKTFDFPNASKSRPAGTLVHEMRVRISIDAEFNIREAEVASDTRPWDGVCEAVVPDYGSLVGLNLVRGFRKALAERFGRVRGCTHINELLGAIPTAAFQTFAGTLRPLNDPGQIGAIVDTCHAMSRGSEPVRMYFPAWYEEPGSSPGAARTRG
ncbi:MAG: DUF2889 domain-containing protein [Betaproteobacteria bacterium]|nr:DUF2889 domain-containing protein [Betaproteobacteria bacterium]